MVNVHLNKFGHVKMSKPCPSCQEMLRWFGIKDVIYTNKIGLFEKA